MTLLEQTPFVEFLTKLRVDSQHASDNKEGSGGINYKEEKRMQCD
jgi:hypothetical protein